MDFGIFTFGELSRNLKTGTSLSPHQRLAELIELAKLADQAGLSFLGLGEHHRHDFALSAPEIVLAAIARETTNLRLSTAVTVLSTQDPVRLFEQFATLDLISDGRAEIIAGRGAFIESYRCSATGRRTTTDCSTKSCGCCWNSATRPTSAGRGT